jgi:hypothetical protein
MHLICRFYSLCHYKYVAHACLDETLTNKKFYISHCIVQNRYRSIHIAKQFPILQKYQIILKHLLIKDKL